MLPIIAILFILLFVLLIVPISIAFKINSAKKTKGYVIFHWLFGVVRFRLGIPGIDIAFLRNKEKTRKKTKKSRKNDNFKVVIAMLRQSAFRLRAIRFIKSLLGAAHAHDLYFRLRIGLGDPADTGRLWGFLGPVAGVAANLRNAEVHIEPEFVDPALEVESHGAFRLIPIQFIALAVAFVLSPAALQAWRTILRSKA